MRGKKKYTNKKGDKTPSGNGIISGLPNIGAPFGTMVLPSLPRLNLNGSASELDSPTAVMARLAVELIPPQDKETSVAKQMNEWYMRMRAVNSGATNYTPEILQTFMVLVRTLRAAHMQATTALQALMANEPEYVNNAAALYYLAGGNNYHAESLKAAQYQNKLINLAKEIEAIPTPNFDIYSEDEFALGYIIREKKGRRCSYAYPLVCLFPTPTLVSTDGVLTPAASSVSIRPDVQTNVDRVGSLISVMETCLAILSTTFIFSTLRGDLIKTYGASAYRLNLVKYMQEGLHISDSDLHIGMLKNTRLYSATSSVITWDTTNKEFTTSAQGGGIALNYPGKLNNNYPIDIKTGSAEELKIFTMFAPVIQRVSGVDVIYSRGYFVRNIVFLSNGSVTSASTRFLFGNALSDAQTSTVQSTSEAGHTNLANVATLWEAMPAYCPRSSVSTIVWHMDNVMIITIDELLNCILQAIRADLDSKAFVAQSRSAQK